MIAASGAPRELDTHAHYPAGVSAAFPRLLSDSMVLIGQTHG